MNNDKRALLVGPAKLWDMKRKFQIDFLKEVGMQPNNKIMDMGCGVLRGGIPIIDYLDEGNYYGFEVRDYVLEEGKQELKESGLAGKCPNLLSAPSIDELDLDVKFDYMLAFSVLIHMTDEIVFECLNFAADNLTDGGSFFANVSIGARQENKWMEFPVIVRSVEHYHKMAGLAGLVMEDIGQLKDLGHHSGSPAQDAHHMLKFRKK